MPQSMPLPCPGVGRVGWLAPVLVGALLTSLAGCSDDTAGAADTRSTDPAAPSGERRTTVHIGEVAGRITGRQRRQVRMGVGRAVDRWWESAWFDVTSPPRRRDRSAYRDFAPGAARLARQDRGTTSAAGLGRRVDEVVPRRREVTVDVLAPGGRPAAATARVRLVVAGRGSEGARRGGIARMTGRLFMTPGGRGWQVFGYDVSTDVPGGRG